jgi:GNS1/SUR4 family
MEVIPHKYAEPIIESWPLMGSPASLVLIISTYLVFVLKIGPKYMKNRKPKDLTTFTRIYNILQVTICSAFVIQAYISGFTLDHMWTCLPKESNSETWLNYKTAQWWFLLLRLSELIETVVFVLRKKEKQVSTLHVYHHISTAIIVWTYVKYNPCEFKSYKHNLRLMFFRI